MKLDVRRSNRVDHDALTPVDELDPFSEKDRPCFADLRDVLARHDQLSRFGVALLP